MSSEETFRRLSQSLAGTFQNRDQALADPAWYVHLRLWCYPTQLFTEDSATFFIEQASAAFKQAPYRQRVLRICRAVDRITAEYYALKDPTAWQGATQTAERLAQLTPKELQSLDGSLLSITAIAEGDTTRFEARQKPGQWCQFAVNGETKFVELAFDAIAPQPWSQSKAAFWMYDKGIDAESKNPTWGAIHGPFKLVKVADYSDKLPAIASSRSA